MIVLRSEEKIRSKKEENQDLTARFAAGMGFDEEDGDDIDVNVDTQGFAEED
jgi:hypothetical protein